MPIKRSYKLYIAIFLILTFFIQFALITAFSDFERVKDPVQKSSANILEKPTCANISLLNRGIRKPLFLKNPTKTSKYLLQDMSYVGVSLISSCKNELVCDYRKEIEQTIPHYFHGGKYKYNLLSI